MSDSNKTDAGKIVQDHRRQWRHCNFVYPVISRRARGLSIGVNLNIDKRCNFSCMYCQINRRMRRVPFEVDIIKLRQELDLAISEVKSGALWEEERFAVTPPEFRRINDIAFSGDGEPTCLPSFDQAVKTASDVIAGHDLTGQVKIVVITNASNMQSPQVRNALGTIEANNGEIWAKLDAGTEEYFKKVNRPMPGLTLETICQNILAVAVAHPVVIQTLFFHIDGQPPTREEIDAYCQRLRWLIGLDARIKLVQLHTIARPPACQNVATMPGADLDAIADIVRQALPDDLPVEVYYGHDVKPQGQE